MKLLGTTTPLIIKRAVRTATFAVAFACCYAPDTCFAQQTTPNAATNEEATAEDETDEPKKMRPTVDLGKFQINDLRPTRNVTAKLTFSMHLAFSKKLTKKQVEQLEGWKHRLRDQVITAVRISYVKDFQEPDLGRLRRNMLVRVNRIFKANLAEEVLLSEFLFRTH